MAQPASSTDAAHGSGPDPAGVRSEDIFVRNYDPYWGYDLSIVVRDADGQPVFQREYFFRPGQIESVHGRLDPGAYEVTVELDGRREKTVSCRVGPDTAETIHVEIGNGLVSVTEGLFG